MIVVFTKLFENFLKLCFVEFLKLAVTILLKLDLFLNYVARIFSMLNVKHFSLLISFFISKVILRHKDLHITV